MDDLRFFQITFWAQTAWKVTPEFTQRSPRRDALRLSAVMNSRVRTLSYERATRSRETPRAEARGWSLVSSLHPSCSPCPHPLHDIGQSCLVRFPLVDDQEEFLQLHISIQVPVSKVEFLKCQCLE